MADSRAGHDLTNQLTIILAFSEVLLADTAPTDPRREDLEEIHNAAVTALRLCKAVEESP